MGSNLLLWVAQGFGVGRIPLAPGTFGSVLGLGWFALLLQGSPLVFFCGMTAGWIATVILAGAAEKILATRDPPSVVADEISAVPLCFVSLILVEWRRSQNFPTTDYFFSAQWSATLILFLAFRVFDIWKPWPIRRLQSLPGGFGILADDLAAAAATTLLAALFLS